MPNKNNTAWSLLAVAPLCFACTTAQQSAAGTTSTSPSPGVGATSSALNDRAANPGPNVMPSPELAAAQGSIGVTDISSQAVGAKVTVAGVFMGFNGSCLSDAPSRSAWHLAASKEPKAPCIYVDGPFPPGLSPAVHAGTNTTVTGTVAEVGTTRYLVSTGQ